MNRLFHFLRWHTPDKISPDPLLELRTRLLAGLFLVLTAVGTPLYIVVLLDVFQTRAFARGTVLTILFLSLLMLTFLRPLSYSIRVTGLLTLAFLAGVATSFSPATPGVAAAWFLGTIILAILFMHRRAGLTIGISSLIAFAIPVILSQSEWTLLLNRTPAPWVTQTLTFSVIAIVLGWTTDTLMTGLATELQSQKSAYADLEAERARLSLSAEDLARRLGQLHTAAEIARISSKVLEPAQLFEQAIHLIRERFDLYYVGLFLLDEAGENAVLVTGTGEAGKAMLAAEHKLAVGGTSMIGWSIANQQARIALDTGEEAIRFDNPYLPLTRSELALPLTVGQHTFGALTIQSSKPRAFDTNDLRALQGMADALAIAIENAKLFQNLQASLQEIETLNRQYLITSWSRYLQETGQIAHTYIDDQVSYPNEAEVSRATANLFLRGQTIGRISLEGPPGEWAEEDLDLIEAVALQASQALENARLIQETQMQAAQEQLLSQFTGRVRESLDMDVILRTALRELGDRLDLAEVEVQFSLQDAGQGDVT